MDQRPNVILLRSGNRNFPVDLEPELRSAGHTVTPLSGLPEYIASPARRRPQVVVMEIGSLAELDRAVLLVDWSEHIQPAAPARYVLLLASKGFTLGERAVKLAAAETVVLPQPTRNILFKLELQSRLLKGAPKATPAGNGFSARTEEISLGSGGHRRVLAVRGRTPRQGAWRDQGNTPSGKIRWRWVTAEGLKPADADLTWTAEAIEAPSFDEKLSAWLLAGEGDNLLCQHGGEILFSALEAEAHDGEEPSATRGYAAGANPEANFTHAAEIPFSSFREKDPAAPEAETDPAPDGSAPPAAEKGPAARAPEPEPPEEEGAEPTRGGPERPPADPASPLSARVTSAAERAKVALTKANASLEEAEERDRKGGAPREAVAVKPAPPSAPKAATADKMAEIRAMAKSVFGPSGPEASKPSAPAASAAPAAASAAKPESGAPTFIPDNTWTVRPGDGPREESPAAAAKRSPEAAATAPTARATMAAEAREAPVVAPPTPAAPAASGRSAETKPAFPPAEKPAEAQSPGLALGDWSARQVSALRFSDPPPTAARPAAPSAHENPGAGDRAPAPAVSSFSPDALATSGRKSPESSPAPASRIESEWASPGGSSVTLGALTVPADSTAVVRPLTDRPATTPAPAKDREPRSPLPTNVPAAEDPRRFLKHRHFEVMTLAQLSDRESSWHPVGRYRIYLSAQHRYYGLKHPQAALPIWIYDAELAPEFLDEQKAWKFYDQLPICVAALGALPDEVLEYLYRACGMPVPPDVMARQSGPAVVIVANEKEEDEATKARTRAGRGGAPAASKPTAPTGFWGGLRAFLAKLFGQR